MSKKTNQPKKPAKSARKPASASKAPTKAKSSTPPATAKKSITKTTTKRASSQPQDSKQAGLIKLLQGEAGATLTQMTKATGWQPHTVRGVISGVLRKKLKLTITTEKPPEGERIYRIPGAVKAAPAPATSASA